MACACLSSVSRTRNLSAVMDTTVVSVEPDSAPCAWSLSCTWVRSLPSAHLSSGCSPPAKTRSPGGLSEDCFPSVSPAGLCACPRMTYTVLWCALWAGPTAGAHWKGTRCPGHA
uniref:Uncharacterized protein n=1 Tax=Anguilla anguilla TaxID=7936 RepID=A0A0E9W913_ANGAN